MNDESGSNDTPVFFGRGSSSHQMMPPGGPDPSAHWGRRYERIRDEVIDRFLAAAHDPQVWRFEVSSGEGSAWWSVVRCARCDYRTRIHRFPVSWARFRGSRCLPMTDGQLRDVVANKEHRATRTSRLTGGSIFALFSVAVVGMLVTEDYTHPMLRVLAVAAGAAAVYLFAKAIRNWHRP